MATAAKNQMQGDRNMQASLVAGWQNSFEAGEVKPYRGSPATLGSTAAAQAVLIVWCKSCRHQAEPDPAEMAERYGAGTSVLDWRARLVCSRCGARDADMVLSGASQ